MFRAHELSLSILLCYLKNCLYVTKLSKITLIFVFLFFTSFFLLPQICQISTSSEILQSTRASRNPYAHVGRLWFCGVLIQLGEFSSDITDDFLNLSCHKLFDKSITFVSLFNFERFFSSLWMKEYDLLNLLRESSTAQICSRSIFKTRSLQFQSKTIKVYDGPTVPELSSIMLIYAWFIFL